MRDGQILGIAGTLEKRVAGDMKFIMELNTLNRTRIDAIEAVLFGGRWSLLFCVALQIWSPRKMRETIEIMHETIMADWNRAAEARAKEKEKEARITVIGNGKHG